MIYFRIDKILLGWLALAAAQIIAGMVIPVGSPVPPHAFEWLLATDFLIAAVIGVLAVRCDWFAWKLAAALVMIPLAVNLVNMIEGAVFLKNAGGDWKRLIPNMVITYVLVLPAWRYIFGAGEPVPPHYSPLRQKFFGMLAWRFAVSDVLYLFLYFAAGAIIFPYVKDFYATQTIPAAGTIVALQILLRGPVFIAVCLVLLRMLGLPRWTGSLAVGLAFTLVSGVAPLLMPNPYFPDSVRWVHFAEVTSSNFLFGAIVGLIWGPPGKVPAPLEMRTAA
ncbi:MAG TPA: hypothetical protein VFB00_03070 [Terriglobales bacterium]|nr:hypothetical protein [Terriglobales bacterium]